MKEYKKTTWIGRMDPPRHLVTGETLDNEKFIIQIPHFSTLFVDYCAVLAAGHNRITNNYFEAY